MRISSFEAHTNEQVDAVLKQLMNHQQVRGLVLDLRDDPGGLLEVVVQIANRFISDGLIVSTKGRFTRRTRTWRFRSTTCRGRCRWRCW